MATRRDGPGERQARALDVRSLGKRGDFTSGDWADPEIEFGFADGPEPGSSTEIKNMADRYGEWLRGWRDFRGEPERFIVADETRILVFVHNTGRGRTSGPQMDQRSLANPFKIHGGRVTRLVLYWDPTVRSPTSHWRARRCRRRGHDDRPVDTRDE